MSGGIVDFDLAIVGSGFGGSILALVARQLGRSVLMLERGQHPRFAIGESSTPLANLLLEELADRYALPRLRPLSKWGTWQRDYPELPCGLKRGFSFFHHDRGCRANSDRSKQLLVAASSRDAVADTHWCRADFDHFLVREAQRAGVEYLDQVELRTAAVTPASTVLEGERLGKSVSVRARLVVDATGPRGFLHRALGLGEGALEHLPETEALYSHFENAGFLEQLGLIAPGEAPPYPIDAAAVHHVFRGGWIWVLRFNNGVVSAGIACTRATASEFGLGDGGKAWTRILKAFPTVGEQFASARALRSFVHAPRLAFRSAKVAGPNWALLPSAAGFIDPLMSTGFALTLLGIGRLSGALEQLWGKPDLQGALESYARMTTAELLFVERLVAALYAAMGNFDFFSRLALLYFAPVSFVEIGAREGKLSAAGSFLLHDHPKFGPAAADICAKSIALMRSGAGSVDAIPQLTQRVLEVIRPFDRISLSRSDRRNWHPVR